VPAGTVFALYVALYNLVRMPMEKLRIDPADIILGQRVNFWVSLILFLVGTVAFVLLWRRRKRTAPAPPAAARPASPASGHVATSRPEAAIAARLRTQRRKKRD
jgi:prolipoprotein diacylglyceryltransferase